MKNVGLIFGFLILVFSCQPKTEKGEISSVNDINQIDFNDVNNVLLDVRTPEEFNDGNIPNSINLDVQSRDFDSLIKSLDKEKIYYVYCQAGGRSAKACAVLEDAGFQKVVNLKDGYKNYQK